MHCELDLAGYVPCFSSPAIHYPLGPVEELIKTSCLLVLATVLQNLLIVLGNLLITLHLIFGVVSCFEHVISRYCASTCYWSISLFILTIYFCVGGLWLMTLLCGKTMPALFVWEEDFHELVQFLL